MNGGPPWASAPTKKRVFLGGREGGGLLLLLPVPLPLSFSLSLFLFHVASYAP